MESNVFPQHHLWIKSVGHEEKGNDHHFKKLLIFEQSQYHWKYAENSVERIINLRKKRLDSKLYRKYVLNLLNEPQHLAAIKTPKLPKIPKKGVTNLRERKLKNN